MIVSPAYVNTSRLDGYTPEYVKDVAWLEEVKKISIEKILMKYEYHKNIDAYIISDIVAAATLFLLNIQIICTIVNRWPVYSLLFGYYEYAFSPSSVILAKIYWTQTMNTRSSV
mgnify:CR=1 FL=1